MGLDAFKTESSSSTNNTTKSSSTDNNNTDAGSSSGKSQSDDEDVDESKIMPWFTVTWDRRNEKVRTHEGKNAFLRRETPAYHDFLVVIPDKYDYSRIEKQFKSLKQCSIKEFMEKDQEYAIDLVERLKSDKLEEHKEECAVCGEELVAIGNGYLEVNGQPIHPEHNVSKVEDEIDVEA